jgi:hypothetical protein
MANVVLVSGSTDWGATGSWDTASVPVDTDSVFLRNSSANIITNLSQGSVDLTLLEIERSFTGDVAASSSELSITATTLNIGRQLGVQTEAQAGSDRIKINLGSVQSTMNVYYSASSSADSGFEPIRLRGTHASNVLNVYGGIVGIATNDPDDTATLATVNQFAGTLNLGGGCTLTTLYIDGGNSIMSVRSAFTTLNQNAGTVTRYGSGAATTISQKAGTLNDYGTGTITTLNVFPGSTTNKWSGAATVTTLNLYGRVDLSNATGTITFTNTNILSEQAVIFDPLGRAVFTNAVAAGVGVRTWTYIGKGGSTYAITA